MASASLLACAFAKCLCFKKLLIQAMGSFFIIVMQWIMLEGKGYRKLNMCKVNANDCSETRPQAMR